MTRRVTISLDDSTVEAIDSVCDEYSIARSRVISDIIGKQLGEGDLAEGVLDAIPEETLSLAKKEREEKRLLDKQKLKEKKHSFADRTRGYFAARLEGEEAYEPEDMADLAEGYKTDAEIWHDDPEEAALKADLVDVYQQYYETAYWARNHADQTDSDLDIGDVDQWFAVGEDIHKLRSVLPEVVEHVRSVADTQGVGFDSDAVIESVARKWSVSEAAVTILVDSMTFGDTSDALRLGGDLLRSEEDLGLPGSSEIEQLPEGAILRKGGKMVEHENGHENGHQNGDGST